MPKKKCREVQPPVRRFVRRPLLVSVGLGCWLLPTLAVYAQQALFSALSLDSVLQTQQTNAPVVEHPDVPHLGPVQLSLGAYSSITLDNDINLSQTSPESDVIFGTGVSLGCSWLATGLSQLNFSSQVGYISYLAHPTDDYFQISPGSALAWNFLIDDWDLTFFDQFSYTRSVLSVASVSNVSGIPIVNNTIGLRAQWQPGHWQIQTGYSYNNNYSDSTAFDYLDSASDYFFARGAWLFAGDAALGLEASMSITDYSHQSGNNNTSYSVGPYLEWQVTRFIHLSLHGGPTFYVFAATPAGQSGSNVGSYYINLDLSHQLTTFLSEDLSVQRSISLSYEPGSAYTEQLNASYSLRWAAKPWLSFSLGLNYQVGQQPYDYFVNFGFFEAEVGATENFDRYGISSSVSYQLTRKISANLGYSHWNRSSNISGNSYGDDNVSLQFQYSF
jgi:hypothetical protein